MRHYVKVNSEGSIVLLSNITTPHVLPRTIWRRMILVNCCNNVLYPGTRVYNYVKAGSNGQPLPNSNVASSIRPKGGKWYGFIYENCCERLPISDLVNDNINTYYNVSEGKLIINYTLLTPATAVSIELSDDTEVVETLTGTTVEGHNSVTSTKDPDSIKSIKFILTIDEQPVTYTISK